MTKAEKLLITKTTGDITDLPLVGGSPAAIYFQESQGQVELCRSSQMPTKGSDDPRWAQMGVAFGNKTPGDELFRSVLLPTGWTKRATEHSMWSELVDDTGKVRGMIFYKAAFYDRSAFCQVVE